MARIAPSGAIATSAAWPTWRRAPSAVSPRVTTRSAASCRRGSEGGAGAEIDGVQIAREDLLLREPLFEPQCQHDLLHLAAQAALGRQIGQPDELLGDRAAALEPPAPRQIVPGGPQDAARIDTIMLVE